MLKCIAKQLVESNQASAHDYYSLCSSVDELLELEEEEAIQNECGVRDVGFIRNSLDLERNRICVGCEERRWKRAWANAKRWGKVRLEGKKVERCLCRSVEKVERCLCRSVEKVERVVGRWCGKCALKKEGKFEWVRTVTPDSESSRQSSCNGF